MEKPVHSYTLNAARMKAHASCMHVIATSGLLLPMVPTLPCTVGRSPITNLDVSSEPAESVKAISNLKRSMTKETCESTRAGSISGVSSGCSSLDFCLNEPQMPRSWDFSQSIGLGLCIDEPALHAPRGRAQTCGSQGTFSNARVREPHAHDAGRRGRRLSRTMRMAASCFDDERRIMRSRRVADTA
jgi:hypothetical protein